MPIFGSSALDRPDVLKWLSDRRAGGIVVDAGCRHGTPFVDGIKWNNPAYLDEPGRFDRLRNLIRSVKEQGLRVWLYDEYGYPSGNAGGAVLKDHPEWQAQVMGCRTWRLAEGQSAEIAPRHGRIVSCGAAPVRGGRADLAGATNLPVSATAGAPVRWTAPAGEWAVWAIERFASPTWKRHDVPRPNANIMDRAAMARFIEVTHDRYARELGGQLKDVDLFFTDEPQLGAAEYWGYRGEADCPPMVAWCDELPGAFRKKHGYDPMPLLPALFLDAGPRTPAFRHDFYDVQSDLVAENYFGQIERWCRTHGVPSSGHQLLEESLLFHLMFSGSVVKNSLRMDLPGTDLLGAKPYYTMPGWSPTPFPEDFSCKLFSSVAHLAGKKGTFSESFALAKQAPLRRVLAVTAWQFAGGITHLCTYGITFDFSAADYAAFCDFAGRLALLCRRGTHAADVAVLLPEASVWSSYTPPGGPSFARYLRDNPDATRIDTVFRDTCHELLRRQRDFDIVTEEFVRGARIRKGRLHIGDESFSILVLPEVRMLSPKTLDAVRDFARSGGQAAFVGSLPTMTPENGPDADIAKRAESLLAQFPDRVIRVDGAGGWTAMAEWMDRRAPNPAAWSGPDGVRILRRVERDRQIVLLANPSATPASGRLASPIGGRVSAWNPDDGTVEERGEVGPGGGIELAIPAESARFLVIEGAPR